MRVEDLIKKIKFAHMTPEEFVASVIQRMKKVGSI